MILALHYLTATSTAHADTFVVQGSTTFNSELMVSYQAAIEAASHHLLEVIPNKSNVGLIALLKGEADLAMISVELPNEVESIQRSNPDLPFGRLQVFQVARTSAALVVHPSNPVAFISATDLRRVLSGEVVDWHELGGATMPIRVVAVREGGGVVSSVEAWALGTGKHITAPNQIRVQNGSQIVKVVEQEPGALGITQMKLAEGRQIKHLATASPIEQQLSLVSLGDPSPALLAIIAACRQAANTAGLE